ncbi:MAG: AbrB/MazE/SpoVT family DNA-binding domain-containing protein [Desulfocapsaceae bacterium]|jgi:AbrB family looped-hinge helix DNA binding protein|nr:AbrB/MazE/SpoVT family DNA-binding domain-containing protein [Desulfocapsaceae bacterium]
MTTMSTLSSKGQITIPKTIRTRHHLEIGDKIEFMEDDKGVVTIWPVTQNVTNLKGMIAKLDKPVSIEEMNHAIIMEGGKL